MDIDVIFRIAGIGLIVAIVNQLLSKADKGEYTVFITLSGVIIIILTLLPEIRNLLGILKDLTEF
ncbi:MAG: stage III sporulation AC/AD family protein [Clostridia bacterium]|nr:stage III sporulation AC/AD family protein [Clostridia bacterium]MBR2418553.1 stage III sporulation AC/AD family protein [Clostridia bacterium]